MNGNGNGTKTLWTVVLTAGGLLFNSELWIVSRMQAMDEDRHRLALLLEQRCGRIEAKLDRLLERAARGKGRGP